MNEITVQTGTSASGKRIGDGDVRTLRHLSATFVADALLFGFTVVGLRRAGVLAPLDDGTGETETHRFSAFSLVHAGMFLLAWIVSSVLPLELLLGAILFVAWGVATFPTRDRLLERLQRALEATTS